MLNFGDAVTCIAMTISGLAPVAIAPAVITTDGSVSYQSASTFRTTIDAAAASHTHTLDGLSDVTIASVAAGEIVRWSGTAWVNSTLAEAGIQPAGAYLSSVTGDATSRAVNTVYAAPSGAAGTATFRLLVAADIPSLDTSKLTSGTLGYARGGTGISAPGATAGNLRWSGSAYTIDTATYALASAIPAASSTTPAALGTAAVGTGTTWARADHVHTLPTAAQIGAATSAHSHTLDGLTDVTITSVAAGEIVRWSGTAWVNSTLAEAGIQPAGAYLTGNQTISLTGVVTGSGTTAIATSIADGALAFAKTGGLQAFYNNANFGNSFESPDPFTSRSSYGGQGGVRTGTGAGPFGSMWYNMVDVRHYNTWSAGVVYGGELVWGMTSATNRMAFRSRAADGTPTAWNEVAVQGSAVSFEKVYTTSNNLGDNIKLGDDCWIGDCWVSNGLQLKGNNDPTKAYIKFGTSGPTVGYDGTTFVIPATLNSQDILPSTTMAYGLGSTTKRYSQAWAYAGYFDNVYATGIQTTGSLSPKSVLYPYDSITASVTLNQSSLAIVTSASDLVLTLPAPTQGISLKIVVRAYGSVGHRIYPATGHTIEFSGMYGTSHNYFISYPAGQPSGVACVLKSGVYEFIGGSSTEWFLSSGPKTYA